MIGWLIPVFLYTLAGYGQEQSRDSVTYLQEVVLGVEQKGPSSLGIVPSDLLTEKAISTQSPIDFAGTFNQIPGVFFLSGALNTNRITIRGVGARTPFGTDKLRMYYNDIPVTNGTGVSALEAFDLENLNTIRVVKGPKSGGYGAALGGAILLQSDLMKQEGTLLRNRISFGSYGLFKANLSLNHQGEKVNAEIRYNRMTTQGYRENNAFDRDGLLVNVGVAAGESHRLNLLVNYIDYSAEIPSSLGRTDYETDPTRAAANWKAAKGFEANKYTLIGLTDVIRLGTGFENTTSLFLSYLDHYEPRPFNILDEFTLGYGFRSVFTIDLGEDGEKTRAVFGFENYRDEYSWSTFENLYRENDGKGSLQGDQISRNKEFRNQFYAFAQFHWQVTDRLKVQAGLTLNKTAYDYRDQFIEGAGNRSAIRDFDPILMPGLDLRYSLGAYSWIYLNTSRGFSNPSLEESLTPEGLINPEISQEKGINYEIGGTGFWFNRRLQGTLALYQMDIKDLLVAQRTGEDEFVGRNAGKTRHRGIEASLQYFMRLGDAWSLSPFLSYTLSDHTFVDFKTEDADYSGNPLTGVPKNRIYGGLQVNSDQGWFWNANYQFVDAIPLTDSTSLYSDAYNLFNTQFGYRTQWGSKLNASLELGVNNIFDTRYASSVLINATGFGGSEPRYYYPGNGRNYYVGVLLLYAL